MNGTIARKAEQIKYDKLLSYYPDTGKPFFNGVLRRAHLKFKISGEK
jgi:hypothetical protein